MNYLRATGRSEEHCRTYENYYKAQGLFGIPKKGDIAYSQELELDLGTVLPSVAGPKRPQDRIELPKLKESFIAHFQQAGHGKWLRQKPEELAKTFLVSSDGQSGNGGGSQEPVSAQKARSQNTQSADGNRDGEQSSDTRSRRGTGGAALKGEIRNGSVLIAAITSCTNTSNPSVMLAAGLLAKKAVERGLTVNPVVKASLAPGSRVVSDYLNKTGLQPYLDQLGFNLVGYGCTTCIGNSGPLRRAGRGGDRQKRSGRRGGACPATATSRRASIRTSRRISSCRRRSSSRSRSPGAWTLTSRHEPLGTGKDGRPVFLKDIWPTLQRNPRPDADRAAAGSFPQAVQGFRRAKSQVERNPVQHRQRL